MRIKIYVAHHKKGFIYKDDFFEPIQVGKSNTNLDLKILGDNTNKNISKLNPYYCELTATYWAWKNDNSDYVGICHYRRYFYPNYIFNYFSKNRLHYFYVKLFSPKNKQLFFLNQISIINIQKEKYLIKFSKWLKTHTLKTNTKIYALKPVLYLNKNNTDLFSEIGIEYINQLKECIAIYFTEYEHEFNLTLNSKELNYANMVIMDKYYFNEYCEFLFGVLEKHFHLNNTNKLQRDQYSRVAGYMGELLTNCYILNKKRKNIKIEYLSSLFINP